MTYRATMILAGLWAALYAALACPALVLVAPMLERSA